jgi:predicted RNA-binding Zn ribbon-like protein
MFEYVGGDFAVDFLNTGDWTARGLENDLFSAYSRLLDWAVGAGAISPDTAAHLQRRAQEDPAAAKSALAAAHDLRGSIRLVFEAVVEGHSPDLTALNAALSRALTHRRLDPAPEAHWVWVDAERDLESPLWPVALAAATLLTSPDAGRLRICAKPDCGWMFVDRSRNGFRRWCQMATCGTEEKTRRRAARARSAG